MRTRFIFLILIVTAGIPVSGFTQSSQACLESDSTAAIANCKKLIGSGITDKKIWYKLASSYYMLDRKDEALRELKVALKTHKNDPRMLMLKRTIETELQEKKEIESVNATNPASLAKGRIKITCLTRDSRQGLIACRDYLEMTSVDSERIGPRLALLESKYGTTIVDSNENRLPTQEKNTQRQISSSTGLSVKSADSKIALDREEIRELQTLLNNMGYPAGAADGVAGQRTRSALLEFSRNSDTGNTALNPRTLADVKRAHLEFLSAQELLNSSQTLHESGKHTAALEQLHKALTTSRHLKVSADYEEKLTIASNNEIGNSDNQIKLATNTSTNTETSSNNKIAGDTALVIGETNQAENEPVVSQELQLLLDQISSFELQRAQQAKILKSRFDSIRSVTALALE